MFLSTFALAIITDNRALATILYTFKMPGKWEGPGGPGVGPRKPIDAGTENPG